MEFCGSTTLDSFFKEGNRRTDEALKEKFSQIVSAVEFLHSHKVFHRDLTLKNILVTNQSQIKIIDFGLATSSELIQEQFCGTPAYICPQILLKQQYHPRSVDIWCLGVILYAMCFGQLPFGGILFVIKIV